MTLPKCEEKALTPPLKIPGLLSTPAKNTKNGLFPPKNREYGQYPP